MHIERPTIDLAGKHYVFFAVWDDTTKDWLLLSAGVRSMVVVVHGHYPSETDANAAYLYHHESPLTHYKRMNPTLGRHD